MSDLEKIKALRAAKRHADFREKSKKRKLTKTAIKKLKEAFDKALGILLKGLRVK